jgi:diguanylate cyclase (GGDEF)-like protein
MLISSRGAADGPRRSTVCKAKENGSPVSLLLLEIDDFKDANETLGHDAGDALLRQVAERLRLLKRDCDSLSRLGGDEFAMVGRFAARSV